jgi:hypothetical protein
MLLQGRVYPFSERQGDPYSDPTLRCRFDGWNLLSVSLGDEELDRLQKEFERLRGGAAKRRPFDGSRSKVNWGAACEE